MNAHVCKSWYGTSYTSYVESYSIASGIEQLQDEKKTRKLCAVNYLYVVNHYGRLNRFTVHGHKRTKI